MSFLNLLTQFQGTPPTRVGLPDERPLGGGVYWRWAFKREGRYIKKSILGGAFIGEGCLKERGRLLEKIR